MHQKVRLPYVGETLTLYGDEVNTIDTKNGPTMPLGFTIAVVEKVTYDLIPSKWTRRRKLPWLSLPSMGSSPLFLLRLHVAPCALAVPMYRVLQCTGFLQCGTAAPRSRVLSKIERNMLLTLLLLSL